jgi:hypothetical protein
MAKTKMMAFALILASISAANAQSTRGCIPDRAQCQLPIIPPGIEKWKLADLMCCCKTYSGGECCVDAEKCGTKPPGCFCASPSVPAKPPANNGRPTTATAISAAQ